MRFVKILVVFLISVIAMCGDAWADDTRGDPLDYEVARYLQAMQFARCFKFGIEKEIAQQGRSDVALQRILSASDEAIVAAAVPVYRRKLSLSEARALADFYVSDTGTEIARQQVANLGNAHIHFVLSPAQRQEFERFKVSPAGAAAIRLTAENPRNLGLELDAAMDNALAK